MLPGIVNMYLCQLVCVFWLLGITLSPFIFSYWFNWNFVSLFCSNDWPQETLNSQALVNIVSCQSTSLSLSHLSVSEKLHLFWVFIPLSEKNYQLFTRSQQVVPFVTWLSAYWLFLFSPWLSCWSTAIYWQMSITWIVGSASPFFVGLELSTIISFINFWNQFYTRQCNAVM